MSSKDLLDEDVSTQSESKVKMSDFLQRQKTKITSETNVGEKAKILEATLNTVTQAAKEYEGDLKVQLTELYNFLDQIGVQFDGFKKLNEKEQGLIDAAIKAHENTKTEVAIAQNNLATANAIPNTWWQRLWGRTGKVNNADAEVKRLKAKETATENAIKTAEDDAELLFRQRLQNADMEQAMDHVKDLSEKCMAQIAERETELKNAEGELKVALEQSNETHLAATKKKEVEEENLQAVEARLAVAKQELGLLTDHDSPEYTAKLQECQEIEREIEENKTRIQVCDAVVKSKESFEMKHNLAMKTIIAQRGNLKTMRAKLKSDLEARESFYLAYLTAMKAANDQKLLATLEKMGVKTDEDVASNLAAMYTASSRSRQEMMAYMPQHNKKLFAVLNALNEAAVNIKAQDEKLKEEYSKMFGEGVQSLFKTDNTEDKANETPANNNGGGTTGSSADLLS